MNVFSAFNGIGCASFCLETLGIPVGKYYASEIDPRANYVASKNYPKTIHYGDITKIKKEHFLSPIHFMCGGSPCQDLSIAGKMAGLNGERSKLFFEFIRLWNELDKPLFFFENVRMKKVHQDKITELFGVEPIYFDSELVSAQTRKRLYWTNIISKDDFVYPEPKGIVLNDILDLESDCFYSVNGKFKPTKKANTIDSNYFKGLGANQTRTCVKIGENDNPFESSARVYSPFGKSPCINTQGGGGQEIKVANVVINVNPSMKGMNGNVYDTNFKAPTRTTNKGEGIKITCAAQRDRYNSSGKVEQHFESNCTEKANAITTVSKDSFVEIADTYRKLTPIEVERCFSLPDNYTAGISDSARYRGLGNGWECATIMEFFKHIPRNL